MAVKKPTKPVEPSTDDDADDLGDEAPEWARTLFGKLGKVLDKLSATEGTTDDDSTDESSTGQTPKEPATGERKPSNKHWLFGE